MLECREMLRVLLVASTLAVSPGAAHAAQCARSGTYKLSHDGDYPMFITARAGTTCEATFGSFGGGNLTFKRLFLVSPPARGNIKLREGGYYIYTAPSGSGTDTFTLRVCGSQDNKPGCATLKYSVTVN
jgi:hypothetical protein